ncbi:MCE family protein [Mycobacteroides abscessus]|uniref:MCE family protein n=1 Tax=Mycobacteroides abscessus TaxID=36809 RepID=UPI00210230DE|nr:MlaD family protein [Mycobacteroides abscessus]
MKMRSWESLNKIWLGAGVLVTAAVLVLVLLAVKHASLGYNRYQAEFVQAAQLAEGNPVMVAGIPVGSVRKVELAGGKVLAEFTVRKGVTLGNQTHAAIKLTGLLGGRYLELSLGGAQALDGPSIPLSRTTVPYDLTKALANATTTFEAIDAEKVRASMEVMTDGLVGVPEALPAALDNVRTLANVIAQRRDQIGALLHSVDLVTATIRDQRSNLGALVRQGGGLIADLAARRTAMRQLFASTTALVKAIAQILGDEPGLDKLLTSLRELLGMLSSHDALIRNTLQSLPLPLRNFANATGSGTAIDVAIPAGPLVDSWMCAISGRAQQFGLTEYFKDCQ